MIFCVCSKENRMFDIIYQKIKILSIGYQNNKRFSISQYALGFIWCIAYIYYQHIMAIYFIIFIHIYLKKIRRYYHFFYFVYSLFE